MSKKRRQFSSDFKFRVALEAAKGQRTISELAGDYQVHPNQIGQWKRQLLDDGADVFARNGSTQCDALLITQGSQGMSLFTNNSTPISIPAKARYVYDVTGAGDTVVATLALSKAAGADIDRATKLANYAAGIVVEKIGTTFCYPRRNGDKLGKCIIINSKWR